MAQVIGLQSLQTKLQRLIKRAEEDEGGAVVGFSAPYATKVHEDLNVYHANGQAKFLEQPAREMAEDLGQFITKEVKRGRSLRQAILLAGFRLLREAQQLVPVRTGNLRASGFVRPE